MKIDPRLESYRIVNGPLRTEAGEKRGMFLAMPGPCGERLTIVADDGTDEREPDVLLGWEHVSVSIGRRMPNWLEMDFVKRLFWNDEQCVVQYHAPRSQWVNNMSTCLHMWRWTRGEFPMPDSLLVGVKEAGEFKSKADARKAEKIARAKVDALLKKQQEGT